MHDDRKRGLRHGKTALKPGKDGLFTLGRLVVSFRLGFSGGLLPVFARRDAEGALERLVEGGDGVVADGVADGVDLHIGLQQQTRGHVHALGAQIIGQSRARFAVNRRLYGPVRHMELLAQLLDGQIVFAEVFVDVIHHRLTLARRLAELLRGAVAADVACGPLQLIQHLRRREADAVGLGAREGLAAGVPSRKEYKKDIRTDRARRSG